MTPAWKSWEITPAATVETWHSGECAMCGAAGRTIIDHCHETGLVRGHLCRGCNNSEGQSNADHWQAWRAWDNPARALNSPVLYEWGRYEPAPLRLCSDVWFLTDAERDEWWAEQARAALAGEEWPTPITVDISERRAAVDEILRRAVHSL
jgi:hypothetical protein